MAVGVAVALGLLAPGVAAAAAPTLIEAPPAPISNPWDLQLACRELTRDAKFATDPCAFGDEQPTPTLPGYFAVLVSIEDGKLEEAQARLRQVANVRCTAANRRGSFLVAGLAGRQVNADHLERIRAIAGFRYMELDPAIRALPREDRSCALHPVPQDTSGDDDPKPGCGQQCTDAAEVSKQWWFSLIGADTAWATLQPTQPVVVAVLDDGVAIDNPAFAGRIWSDPKEENGVTGADDDGDTLVDDVHGWDFLNDRPDIRPGSVDHGTSVAGIVAQMTLPAANMIKIMPLRVGPHSYAEAHLVAAIDYAVAHGASIIDMSLHGMGYQRRLEEALRAAATHDVLIIVSAGNLNKELKSDPSYPAAYALTVPNVAAIRAIGSPATAFCDSNYVSGTALIAAPGREVCTAAGSGRCVEFGATSAAAPFVASAAALIRSDMCLKDLHRGPALLAALSAYLKPYSQQDCRSDWPQQRNFTLLDLAFFAQYSSCK